VGSGELPTAVGVVSAAPREIPMPQPVLGVMLEDTQAGVRIGSVMPESPAEEAGLEDHDVVLELNGKAVENREQLVKLIRGLRPGDTVDLLVRREDEKLTIQATLTEINSLAQGRRVDFQNSLGGPLSTRRWGFPSVLQHDTVLRPRDCGGPIVDLYGNAVGVNIARAGRVASYALPVSALAPVLDEVRAGVYVRKDGNSSGEESGAVSAEDTLSQVENVAPEATLTSQK
jgi:serine protease Do